jgi:putative transcriptional regulator
MKMSSVVRSKESHGKIAAVLTVAFIAAIFTVLPEISVTGTPSSDHRRPFHLTRNPDSPHLPEPDQFDTKLSKGKFLVASRKLGDARFQETVVLLISYDRNGAAGLIINRPIKMSLSDTFPDSRIFKKRKETVYFGGPVELDRLLFLIRSPGRPEESAHVLGSVYVSSSRTVLDRLIGKPKTGEHVRVYAGYAGWAAGQLDAEVARGDWHVIQADAKTIFDKKSEKIWPELIRRGSELQVRNSRQILIL